LLTGILTSADYTAEVIYDGTSHGRLVPQAPPYKGPWPFPVLNRFSPDGAPQPHGSAGRCDTLSAVKMKEDVGAVVRGAAS
jgi:hypothetical protein